MGPDPTRGYFWPAVNKRPTRVLSDRIQRYFFWPEGKKMEKFDVFRGNFPNSNPNHKWLTRTNPSHKKLTRPGSKILDLDPSLVGALILSFNFQLFVIFSKWIFISLFIIFKHHLIYSRWTNFRSQKDSFSTFFTQG